MHVCVYGGGSALAQHVMKKYLWDGHRVTAVCRRTMPIVKHENLCVTGCIHRDTPAIDILITLCGAVENSRIIQMPSSVWNSVIDSTLSAVYRALSAGLGIMAKPGNVVILGSIVSSTGGYGCANYAAAKAGLVGLVRAAANEHAKSGVCINLLELGYTSTGMGERLPQQVVDKILPTIPLGRFADPDEVVEAIDFLARTRYMTGNILTLAGGLR